MQLLQMLRDALRDLRLLVAIDAGPSSLDPTRNNYVGRALVDSGAAACAIMENHEQRIAQLESKLDALSSIKG